MVVRVATKGESKMIYGYTRISTNTQEIARQINNIKKEFPTALIIEEVHTGTKIDRPNFNKMIKNVKSNDTIVFDSVSRMSRSAEEGTALYMELFDKGVNLVFLKEPHINTDSYKRSLDTDLQLTGNSIADEYIKTTIKVLKMIAKEQIKIAFDQSQKEVDDLKQRIKEGIEVARMNGKKIGRELGDKLVIKKKLEKLPEIKKYLEQGLKDSEIMKLTGLARNTYYKYKKQL